MPRQFGNLTPPFFGPGPPMWPRLKHLVYVSGGYAAPNLAQGYIVQWTPAGLRLRELVWIWEPNGIGLPRGAYLKGRLVGAYPPPEAGASLPLVGVSLACCGPTVAPSSSSVSPSSVSPSSRSSSSASAVPAIQTICCPNAVPTVVHLTITSGCACENTTFPLFYDPVGLQWVGNGKMNGCTNPGGDPCDSWLAFFTCFNTGVWNLRLIIRDAAGISIAIPIVNNPPSTLSCFPLNITWVGNPSANPCCGNLTEPLTATLTV